MRKTTIKMRSVRVKGERYYLVTFPKLPKGRARQFFKDKGEAETFLAQKRIEKENHGIAAMSFTDRDRAEYLECVELLKPYGATLRQAVMAYLPHVRTRQHSCGLDELVTRLLATKEKAGKSARYLKDLRLRLGSFAESFKGKRVADVSRGDVEAWLHALHLSPTSVNNYRRVLVVLFNFAQSHNLCLSNPAEDVEVVTSTDKPPGILSPLQAAELLNNAHPSLVPVLAIGLFAGLRRAELERLDWREVKFSQGLIEVTAKKAKSARRRLVNIESNLAEWLRPHVQPSGNVWPANFESLFEKCRSDAGIVEWPENGLRHSFASYHLAHYSDAARTALELGHTTTVLLFTHYRALCTKEDASRFWSIAPVQPANVLALTA